MSGFDDVAKKVSRPPGAQNCARLNVIGDGPATTLAIARFAVAIPPFNYIPGTNQCTTHVRLGLSLATAKAAVLRSGSPAGRQCNADFVEAFFEFDEERGYSRCKIVDSFQGEYRLSRNVRVPTVPTFTVLEHGQLVPITVCGWKSLPLDRGQLRLLMTMLEFGLYSHVDYRRSPAEVVFFLEEETPFGPKRQPHVIRRGDFTLLSERDMREQAELYVRAQAAAMPIAQELWLKREKKRQEKERDKTPTIISPANDGPTLFDQ